MTMHAGHLQTHAGHLSSGQEAASGITGTGAGTLPSPLTGSGVGSLGITGTGAGTLPSPLTGSGVGSVGASGDPNTIVRSGSTAMFAPYSCTLRTNLDSSIAADGVAYRERGFLWHTPGNLVGEWHVGPNVGACYETAGDYTVTLYVDGTQQDTDSFTVEDPDVYFSSENGRTTYVVSGAGNFSGAPSGATQITSSNASTVLNTYTADDVRILFRSGETFTCNADVNRSGSSNSRVAVDMFGAAGTEDSLGIGMDIPIFDCDSMPNGVGAMQGLAMNRWATRNIHFDNDYDTATPELGWGIGTTSGITDALLVKCKFTGFRVPVEIIGGTNHHNHTRVHAFNCAFTDWDDTGWFGGSTELIIANCDFQKTSRSSSHNVRTPYNKRSWIAYNTLDSYDSSGQSFKIHSQSDDIWSEMLNMFGNEVTTNQAWPYGISIKDSTSTHVYKARDVLLDSNVLKPKAGGIPQRMFYLTTQYTVVRNNRIMDGAGTYTQNLGMILVSVQHRTTTNPLNHEPAKLGYWIYNNSVYLHTSSITSEQCAMASFDDLDASAAPEVRNCVYQGPSLGLTPLAVTGGDSGQATASNNTMSNSSTTYFADPTNDDLTPSSSSALIDAGTATINGSTLSLYDANKQARGGSPDIGAIEYVISGTGAGTLPSPLTGSGAGTVGTAAAITGTGAGTLPSPITGTGVGGSPVTGTGAGTLPSPITGGGLGTIGTPSTPPGVPFPRGSGWVGRMMG